MIYKNTWILTGTPEQVEIVKSALDQIHFPWERLNLPEKPTEIGWMDLNDRQLHTAEVKLHQTGTKGIIDGRQYTLGIFYTHSGRIYIDNLLVKHPDMARATVSAEIAHSVDYFLPLTNEMKDDIMKLMHPHGQDEHTWWEVNDYGTEYFSLAGEAFMQAFTTAYSDIDFGDASSFGHHAITKETAPKLRAILGIERTDAPPVVEIVPEDAPLPQPTKLPPLPADEPPVKTPDIEQVPAPVPEAEPLPPTKLPPLPAEEDTKVENKYISLGTSNVYHLLSHYDHWQTGLKYATRIQLYKTDEEAKAAGERPCKVCID